ncbi:MAG TPA: vWA domain-containing protein [Nannocystaceae bacterium]|nr:vWA domain-containing protein [Nannocystaceae bacterium]
MAPASAPSCATLALAAAFAACVAPERPERGSSGGIGSGPPQGDDDGSSSDASGGSVRLDLGGETGTPPPDSCRQDVDIVFAMDVTGSMGELIAALVADLDTVDAAVQALDLPSPPRYGIVVFADDWALLNEGAPYPDLAAVQAELASWIAFTEQDGQIGGGGELNESFPENSLDALFAATEFAWRPADTTTRIVIHVTDDTFWNGPGVFNGEMVAHDYAGTIAALQAAQVRVFAFAAERGDECECVDVSAGWFAPYDGQPSIPDGTDGGIFDILAVTAGTLSLGAAIPEAVAGSVCEPYEPVG